MSVIGINVGLKSLLASKAALEVIGHNLANANTPGYSRQGLDISASRSLMLNGLAIGNGVDADVVRRTTDALINKRLTLQGSTLARLVERHQGLSDVESFFGEPGEQGLSSLMSSFFDRVSGLSADPTDRVQRSGVLEAANDIAAQFHNLAGGLSAQVSDAYERVAAQVGQVNTLTARIADLNKSITAHEAGGTPANDMRDQRELALRELAQLADISFHEAADGKVQVQSQGQLLVGPSRANKVAVARQPGGAVELSVAGATRPWQPKGGSIGGLLALAGESLPGFLSGIDQLAKSFVFEMNKAHATGVPGSGPFHELTAAFAFEDTDGDGNLLDEQLGAGTLPFDVQDGELWVNVTDEATGALTRRRIEVDADRTTVGDLLSALDAVPGLSASLNAQGELRIAAAQGLAFDFSRRLDTRPDAAGTFGGGLASLGSAGGAPFALADGATLDLVGAGGPFTVTFDAADFDDIANATADEVAAALNADAGLQAGGLRAVVVGDRVALQSTSSGSAASFDVAGGSALAAFGWTAGTTVSGHDTAVSVELGGAWTGTTNQSLTFVPSGDGTIGTTPGLTVDVLDAGGNLVATLAVGAGYQPGSELAVAEGLTVRFGFGELSATDNDALRVEALADSDTSDLLGALGMNALFVGTDAATIALRPDVERDPTLLATSASGASGDNGVLLDLLRAADTGVRALDDQTLSGFYGGIVGDVGFSVRSTANAMEVEQFVADSLAARREQVSGVNVDEELVDMIRFEQAFAAAAQYIQVINQTQDELLSLL